MLEMKNKRKLKSNYNKGILLEFVKTPKIRYLITMRHHHTIHAFPYLLGWQHHMENSQGCRSVGKTYGSPIPSDW